jgi:acyl-CoA synthetase (AMP-forming)/AMP-acid ligase II
MHGSDPSTNLQDYDPSSSILIGPPLRDPLPSSWRLTDILYRASLVPGAKGVRFLNDDNSEEFLTYRQLLDLAQGVAKSLTRADENSTAQAIISTRSLRQFLIAFWACLSAGIVPVPCALPLEAESREWRNFASVLHRLDQPLILTSRADFPILSALVRTLGDSSQIFDVDGLISAIQHDDKAPNSPVPISPRTVDDVVFMLMTSGSSGVPKLVTHTHRTVKAYCAGASQYNNFSSDEVMLNWLPLDHVGGLASIHLLSIWLACDQIQAPMASVFAKPLRWIDWIDRYRATVSWAPNFAFSLLNQYASEIEERDWDLSCINCIVNAGEPIVYAQAARFLKLLEKHKLRGNAMRPAWGMSETCSGAVFSDGLDLAHDAAEPRYVPVGTPRPGLALRIVTSEGQMLPQGRAGELQVRGPCMTPGYYRNEAATAESFSGDGWFRTGDTAVVEGGQLTIVGRSKHVIIINGCNYTGVEIEATVAKVPGVRPTCIVAVAMRGASATTDRIGVALAIEDSYQSQQERVLREVRRTLMQAFHCSTPILAVVEEIEIPRTSLGKVLHEEVRKMLARGAA